MSKRKIKNYRHKFTKEECSKGGKSSSSRLGEYTCQLCGAEFKKHSSWAGHLGLHAYAQRWCNGDIELARINLGLSGAAATDPFPQNGAFAEGHKMLERYSQEIDF